MAISTLLTAGSLIAPKVLGSKVEGGSGVSAVPNQPQIEDITLSTGSFNITKTVEPSPAESAPPLNLNNINPVMLALTLSTIAIGIAVIRKI